MLTKAIGSTNFYPASDERSFENVELQVPAAKDWDLLVEVQASAINPIDIAVRKSLKNESEPKILGFDACAIVIAKGSQVQNFQVGDQVFYAGDYNRSGSNSQFQLIDSRLVGHAPSNLTPAQIAALPLTSLTAYELLFEKLNLTFHENGKTILIINGAGGVGSMAIQLAKLCGLQVIATASRPETKKWVSNLGADLVLNHRHNLVEEAKQHDIQAVDYILALSDVDEHWSEIVTLLKPVVGKLGTITNMTLPRMNDLKRKSVIFAWEWMFAKSFYQTENMATQGQYLNEIAKMVDQGQLQTTLNTVIDDFSAAGFQKATKIVESKQAIGKVVVQNTKFAR